MPVTRVGSVKGVNAGNTTPFVVAMPEGVQTGDLIFFFMQSGSATAYLAGTTEVKKWWSIHKGAVNSRQVAILARIYDPDDPVSDYTFQLNSSATARYIVVALRNHSVGAAADLSVSSPWLRTANGGSQAIIRAPGFTAASNRDYALAFFGEATTAAGSWTMTEGDFTLVEDFPETSIIEYLTVFEKHLENEPSGDVVLNYGVNSLNGFGMQIALPEGLASTPTSGLVKSMGSLSPDNDSITAASKYTGELAVEAVLYDTNDIELNRIDVIYDPTTKWGNAKFINLDPDTEYIVRYIVNDVPQVDSVLNIKTLPTEPSSFTFVSGSCNLTGSDHLVWTRILEEDPLFISHQGDAHYLDATTDSEWRSGMESLFINSAKFQTLLANVSLEWKMDNHDRIITNPTGAGTGLNLGETDPRTQQQWKHLAGYSSGWASSDTLGRAWRAGRVLFIHTDMWSVRDDGDGDPAPRTFLGAQQKQWFKDTLEEAEDAVLIVWFCQWTARNHANGRWNSFPEETSELESWLNARPNIKKRMVMIGGDSHGLQADDGSRTDSIYRFNGIPSLNISGFNKSATEGDGSSGWGIANSGTRPVDGLEYQWGAYSKVTITDNGSELRFRWEGVSIGPVTGPKEVLAWFERSYGQNFHLEGADAVFVGDTLLWRKDTSGTP